MADVRVVPNVALSDGATPSQTAAVDASGRLSVSLTAASATVTVDSELPAAAALADAAANPTTPTVGAAGLTYNGTTWDRQRSVVAAQDTTGTGIAAAGILGQLDDTATATVTENQFAPVRISTRRALLVEGVASGTAIATTVSGTVTVDSELPAAAALADAAANPTVPGVGGFLMGYNGATWDRVRTANTGRLQVDVITGGGSDTPTTPVNSYDTTAAVAAGATDNHDSADLGGSTRKLTKVVVGASVALKGEIQSVINGAGTTIGVIFSPAGGIAEWEPPHRDYASVVFSANAGFDGFRVIRTNLDASEAADVYSNILYEA